VGRVAARMKRGENEIVAERRLEEGGRAHGLPLLPCIPRSEKQTFPHMRTAEPPNA